MPHHHLAAEDWVTRDDMAVLMRKSLDTVKRVHEKHNLETKKDEAGRVLVNVGDYLELGRLKPEDLTAGATPAESVEVLRALAVPAVRPKVGSCSHSSSRPRPRTSTNCGPQTRISRSSRL